MAISLDEKLQSAHAMLIATAHELPHDLLNNPDKAQTWLDNRIGIRNTFASGRFLFTPEGRIFVESPQLPGRRGLDLSFREHYRTTIATGKPYISVPYPSSKHGRPTILMTVPIYDANGHLIVIMGGALDLLNNSIFSDMANTKIGKTGYLYLYTKDRIMISHPDQTLLLKNNVPLGLNPLFDRSTQQGFEGSGETTSYKGIPVIASFKRLPETGWILASHYPINEAFLPITQFKTVYLLSIGLALLLGTAGSWWLAVGITRNLNRLTGAVQKLDPHNLAAATPVDIRSSDEIRTLADAFNTLLKETTRLTLQLMEAQELSHTGSWEHDHQTDLMILSPEAYRIYEQKPEQFIPTLDNIFSVVHPDDREPIRTIYQNIINYHQTVNETFRLQMPDGRIKHIQVQCKVEYDQSGLPLRTIGTIHDITAQITQQQRQERLFNAISQTGTYLLLIAPDFTIRYMNTATVIRPADTVMKSWPATTAPATTACGNNAWLTAHPAPLPMPMVPSSVLSRFRLKTLTARLVFWNYCGMSRQNRNLSRNCRNLKKSLRWPSDLIRP